MSISGNLEDVSAADVMQFIHLGRRTGTLVLEDGERSAMVGFHDGKLISARRQEQPLIGDLLVQRGLLDPERLERAILRQKESEEDRTLGQILLAQGDLDPEALRDTVFFQIKQAIGEIVQWDSGRFEFVVDDLRPVDEISLYPGDVLEDSDLNTQMVLLEAARIFDERSRRGAAGEPEDDPPPAHDQPLAEPRSLAAARSGLAHGSGASGRSPGSSSTKAARLEASQASAAALRAARPEPEEELDATHPDRPFQLTGDRIAPESTEIRVATEDEVFFARFREAIRWLGVPVRRVDLQGAGAGEIRPILLFDLRHPDRRVADLRLLCRAYPEIPVVALVDEGFPLGTAYGAGAVAVLPAEPEAVTACVGNLLHNLRAARLSRPSSATSSHDAMSRLRRVFGDLRSGLITATVALNLMHIISESVERAVLFLVRQDCLAALGAFGEAADGRPLAELTRGVRLPLIEPSGLSHCVQTGEAQSFEFEKLQLPPALARTLGSPKNGQSVVFPVLGTQRVIAAIYADNGPSEKLIEDIEILELAAAQVGMAFENELLRHQIAQSDQ